MKQVNCLDRPQRFGTDHRDLEGKSVYNVISVEVVGFRNTWTQGSLHVIMKTSAVVMLLLQCLASVVFASSPVHRKHLRCYPLTREFLTSNIVEKVLKRVNTFLQVVNSVHYLHF